MSERRSYNSEPNRSRRNASSRSDDASRDSESYRRSQRDGSGYSRDAYNASQRRDSGQAPSRELSRRAAQASSSRNNVIDASAGMSRSAQKYSRQRSRQDYSQEIRKRKRKKRIVIALCCVAGVLLAAGIGIFAYVQSMQSKLNSDVSDEFKQSLADNADSITEPFYVLILGEDRSDVRQYEEADYAGDNFRSDSIILARVDPTKQLITLISIHRDIMVDLSAYGGTGQDKLNSAFSYGGAELSVKTVEKLTGFKISHYVEVDLDGLNAITNQLGGVEVDVPETFYDDYLQGGLTAGYQTLNGEQALLFCRARHAFDDIGDGDQYRAAHQRIFIKALAKKVLASDPATLVSVVTTMCDSVRTDMSVSDIVTLATEFKGMDTDTGIYSAMSPTTSEYINETWFEVLDTDAWNTMLKRVDQGLTPVEETASNNTVSVKNGSGISGAAEAAAAKISALGYTTTTGDADSTDYPTTIVIYSPVSGGTEEDATKIAAAIGVDAAAENDGTYSTAEPYLVVVGADWTG